MRSLLAAMVLFLFGAAGFAASKKSKLLKRIEHEGDAYTIRSEGCEGCPSGVKLIVEKAFRDKTQVKKLITNGTRNVLSLSFFTDKVILVGEINSNVKMVNVLRKNNLKLLDYFYCFTPVISPTGRYILCRKFYPRFGEPSLKTDLYLVYDLKKNALGNRVSTQRWELNEVAGIPVYPKKYAVLKSYNASSPAPRRVITWWAM